MNNKRFNYLFILFCFITITDYKTTQPMHWPSQDNCAYIAAGALFSSVITAIACYNVQKEQPIESQLHNAVAPHTDLFNCKTKEEIEQLKQISLGGLPALRQKERKLINLYPRYDFFMHHKSTQESPELQAAIEQKKNKTTRTIELLQAIIIKREFGAAIAPHKDMLKATTINDIERLANQHYGINDPLTTTITEHRKFIGNLETLEQNQATQKSVEMLNAIREIKAKIKQQIDIIIPSAQYTKEEKNRFHRLQAQEAIAASNKKEAETNAAKLVLEQKKEHLKQEIFELEKAKNIGIFILYKDNKVLKSRLEELVKTNKEAIAILHSTIKNLNTKIENTEKKAQEQINNRDRTIVDRNTTIQLHANSIKNLKAKISELQKELTQSQSLLKETEQKLKDAKVALDESNGQAVHVSPPPYQEAKEIKPNLPAAHEDQPPPYPQ